MLPPHDGIRDIFTNGHLYAFECATAVVIILYKAILESMDPKQFDSLFSDLLLYDWHLNSNLRLKKRLDPAGEAVEGDILYYHNPDYDPSTPWWRGENVIKLDQNLYYGHGIGIKSAEAIITELNSTRKSGSTQTAFLDDRFDQLDFAFLSKHSSSDRGMLIVAKIGMKTYIY